jgi:hypothetical protein
MMSPPLSKIVLCIFTRKPLPTTFSDAERKANTPPPTIQMGYGVGWQDHLNFKCKNNRLETHLAEESAKSVK